MPGFPIRPSRASFGPTREDQYPVVDPVRFVSAATFNLEHWQTAGLGAVSPLAWVAIAIDGADAASLGASHEAWDPAGSYVPTVTKLGVGHYRITYAATYPDELGTSIATNIRWGLVQVQLDTLFHARCRAVSAYVVEVWVYDALGVADDPTSSNILVVLW